MVSSYNATTFLCPQRKKLDRSVQLVLRVEEQNKIVPVATYLHYKGHLSIATLLNVTVFVH